MSAAQRTDQSLAGDIDASLEAEVTSVLTAYRGDARAAIRDLILENALLENQVEEAVGGLSAGYLRASPRVSRRR